MVNKGTETLERGQRLCIATEAIRVELRFLKIVGTRATFQWAIDGEAVKSVDIDGQVVRKP